MWAGQLAADLAHEDAVGMQRAVQHQQLQAQRRVYSAWLGWVANVRRPKVGQLVCVCVWCGGGAGTHYQSDCDSMCLTDGLIGAPFVDLGGGSLREGAAQPIWTSGTVFLFAEG